MTAIEIARRFSQLGQVKDACGAYTLALHTNDAPPAERLEACCYLLERGEDARIPLTYLIRLRQEGFFPEEIFRILTQMFYQPYEREFQKRYEENRKLLLKYPYLFRKDFPAFQDLPVRFLRYDSKGGYVPFFPAEQRMEPFVNVKDTIISRNFFRDLEKPVLAEDVYSQYELEYLYDNVRPSEWVGRENHIYLRYADWAVFCSWLQTLDFKALLRKKKIVFLMEDEIKLYPIDFEARFGIDYSKYPARRVKIREVKRMIWHTQFSSSNGGDFFNEVFDAHPNLYYVTSVMYDSFTDKIDEVNRLLRACPNMDSAQEKFRQWENPWLVREMYNLKDRTDTDALIAIFMQHTRKAGTLDNASRIVPAIFLQPHFSNVTATLKVTDKGDAQLDTNVYDIIHSSAFLQGFKYVKTFTPIRRFTTSYGSTLKFMEGQLAKQLGNEEDDVIVMPDLQIERILNRTYLRNPEDRLFRDSVIVRFEDGKLNPEATFSKLAEFLDIPYTESMTYCSLNNVRDMRTEPGNVIGFDPETVYRTYDEYVTDSDRRFIEYFMRDAYQYYGYGFLSYDGSPADHQIIMEWMKRFDRLEKNIVESWSAFCEQKVRDTLLERKMEADEANRASLKEAFVEELFRRREENRQRVVNILQRGLRFVNKNGQPLEMTPMLQPDPALLVQPLYH